MSAQPPHRVLRLVLELQTSPAADARKLQDAVQRVLNTDWLPQIEQACTSLGQPGLVQRIGQLTLDLGSLPAQALLAAAGQASASGLAHPNVHAPAGGSARQATGQQFGQRFSAALGQALQSASVVQADLELVAFFLHTGALPWWADVADRNAVQRAALALLQGPALDWRGLLGTPDAPNSGRLVAALRGGAGVAPAAGADTALARLLDQHLQPGPGGAWPAALHQAWWALLAQTAVVLGMPLPALHNAWWRAALASQLSQSRQAGQPGPLDQSGRLGHDGPLGQRPSGAAGPIPAVLAWLPQALQRTADTLGLPTTALPQTLHRLLQHPAPVAGTAGTAVPAAIRHWLATQVAARVAPAAPGAALRPAPGQSADWVLASAAGAVPASAKSAAATGQAAASAQGDAAHPVGAAAATRRPSAPTTRPPPEHSAAPPPSHVADALQHGRADGLYIDNAGLVWLWPFLPRFFERLGLWQQRQWAAPGAAQRAALLLQFAASGDADPPEFQLLLNKLLCGLPLDAPLQGGSLASGLHQGPLTDAEQAECEALLVATIAQAPILRAMSVAGLRASFVLRSGQLSGRDGHPLLQVERSSFDLVLDRIPWGVSIVRLPWMASLLQVAW